MIVGQTRLRVRDLFLSRAAMNCLARDDLLSRKEVGTRSWRRNLKLKFDQNAFLLQLLLERGETQRLSSNFSAFHSHALKC